ncbi:MAG: hypothetical protein ACP5SI_03490 [Chloroflexia bacterium]
MRETYTWQELEIDLDHVLRSQGADPAALRKRNPVLLQAAERALVEGRSLIRAAAVHRELRVVRLRHDRFELEGGGFLAGPLLAQHLAAAERVIVAVCTIGEGLEARVSTLMVSDPIYAMALDGFGSAAVEALENALCRRFATRAERAGERTSLPLSPGQPGWPLAEGQAQIFSLVEASEVGVRLTDHAMMVPRKSLSFVVGVGRELQVLGSPCDMCPLKERCRHRSDPHA